MSALSIPTIATRPGNGHSMTPLSGLPAWSHPWRSDGVCAAEVLLSGSASQSADTYVKDAEISIDMWVSAVARFATAESMCHRLLQTRCMANRRMQTRSADTSF